MVIEIFMYSVLSCITFIELYFSRNLSVSMSLSFLKFIGMSFIILFLKSLLHLNLCTVFHSQCLSS